MTENSKHPTQFLNKISQTIHVDRTVPRNIVVFGQTGAGKSSIINMLAGNPIAKVSGGASGCTPSNERYPIPNGDDNYVFWDTAGLNEAEDGTVSSQVAVQNLLNLVNDHGVNLLVYCIRERFPNIIRVNYDLFWGIICRKEVPEHYRDPYFWKSRRGKELHDRGQGCQANWLNG